MPTISRQNSSFGLSNSSLGSVSSAIFDRFRGFGSQSKQKALEERWRRPLTARNVETFVEDQRIDEACGTKNRSREVQIGFWIRQLPDAEDAAVKETEVSMSKTKRAHIDAGCDVANLPDGGSYSESCLAER